jgi:site-specific recombinase XerD
VRPADEEAEGKPMMPVRSYVKDNLVLAEKFSQWLEIRNYSVNTRKAYGGLVADFCRFLGSRNLIEVQPSDVREYMAHLFHEGLSQSSLDRQLQGLRTFFDFLNLVGLVHSVAPRFVRSRR